MYSKEDITRAKNGMIKMIAINVAIVVLMAALAITGMMIRQLWLAITGCILVMCLGYGFFMLKTGPWVSYFKFIRDMMAGRTRETIGTFVEYSEEVRTAEGGVRVHDFMVDTEEAEDPLLFYWDDDKPLPQLKAGEKIRILSYGRIVREMNVVTEA